MPGVLIFRVNAVVLNAVDWVKKHYTRRNPAKKIAHLLQEG